MSQKVVYFPVECPNDKCPSRPFSVTMKFFVRGKFYSAICPMCKEIVFYSSTYKFTYLDRMQYNRLKSKTYAPKWRKAIKEKTVTLGFIICPMCGNKGSLKLHERTTLKNPNTWKITSRYVIHSWNDAKLYRKLRQQGLSYREAGNKSRIEKICWIPLSYPLTIP